MYSVLLSLYLIVSVLLIGLILVQHGKGASMGASFGAGASNTVFGSTGSGNFLTHSTAVLAALFFAISLGLSALYAHSDKESTDFSNLQDVADQTQVEQATPVSDLPADTKNNEANDANLPVEKAEPAKTEENVSPASSDLPAETTQVEAAKTEVAAEAAKAEEKVDAVKTEVAAKAAKAEEKVDAVKTEVAAEAAKAEEKVDAVKTEVATEAAKAEEKVDAVKTEVATEPAKVEEKSAK